MKRGTKNKIRFSCLVLLAVWPFVHHLLVVNLEITPWAHFGLSMYAVDRPLLRVVAFEIARDNGPLEYVSPTVFSEEERRAVNSAIATILDLRRYHGTLYDPGDVAETLFAEVRGIDRFAVIMKIVQLGPDAVRTERVIRCECRRGTRAFEETTLR